MYKFLRDKRAQAKRYRETHLEEAREYSKKWKRRWRKDHPEKAREIAKRYYHRHKKQCRVRILLWQKKNPEKIKAARLRWYHMNREKAAMTRLLWKYGLDEKTGRALLARPCGICKGKTRGIDHDHKTGKIRGSLCQTCNVGIGMFKDSPILLRKAIRYLAKKRS